MTTRLDAEMEMAVDRGTAHCPDCRGHLSDHERCSGCDRQMCEKATTELEFARGLCWRCLPVPERRLIAALQDAGRIAFQLRRNQDLTVGARQMVGLFLARLRELGVNPERVVADWEERLQLVVASTLEPRATA